ncbi:hypothetical protein I8748_06285 [Nostoc sp. CENA67]|uniref:Uncharacterized protein n=1 Tax=Amazonocrinis nigriterrae CENA67 TaxID=2794033 RepID=A0A8J7L9S0_9NOST|nr:hypothetical protein [Amazonocrinis nigriterrae]MBH8561786.1 hypothetical protein [Amazonocrinis nigriterrae CENA67]
MNIFSWISSYVQNKRNESSVNRKLDSSTPNIQLIPRAVYLNEISKLYTLDLATNKAILIGEIAVELSDIAFVDSQLYGLGLVDDKTKLVKIDLNSGEAIAIGDIGFTCVGLAYNCQRQILYATSAKQLIAINLETGKGTPALTVTGKEYNCGEVAFNANGKAYITLIGYDKKKLLATCDLDTSEVKIIGDIGFADVTSLEFVNDVLYGVTGNFFQLGKDGQLISIDTKTGKGTLVAITEPIGRWAGITIYEPATKRVVEITPEVKPEENFHNSKTMQVITTAKGKNVNILTIDTKTNCYVIDPNQMNNLQQNVATSFTLEKGNFDIRITEGRYSYAKSKTEGEPFVLLWIYGIDGTTIINKNTGFEVGATWTTLNEYNDTLKLEVKGKAVINALYFDFNNADNSGSINLLITSNKQYFNSRTLTVDSKKNCYVLDENYLSTLKQTGGNFIELNPGNYRLKIREGNASYWSDNKKFNLEPWALILIQGGKFTTKLTGIEIEETWVSLNGLKDEVVLEVKEKTTLTGLFIDTYKEDNEGQIILAIEQLGEAEITERRIELGDNNSIEIEQTNIERKQENYTFDFTFRFEEEEFKKKWEEQLKQIDSSTKVTDKVDIKLENKYWDQLEQLLLKSYEERFNSLSIEVAKVRFSMDAYLQQVELSLKQNLQDWSDYYLERILEDKINVEISNKINQQLNLYFDQNFEQRIRNNISLILNNIINKQELNQYVNQQVNNSFEQNIRNNINLIINSIVNKQEFNQFIDRQFNQQIDSSFEQNIRKNTNLIAQNLINNSADLSQYVSQQVDNSFEQNVRNKINLITQSIINNNTELDQYVGHQVDNSFERNIRNNVNLITQSIINDNTELNQYVSQQVDNSFEQNVRNKINLIAQNLINNSAELNRYVSQQVDNSFEQNVRNKINLITQSIINDNTELNQYVSQQVDNSFEQNVRNKINLITQSIINNNTELNQYVSQQVDNSFEQNVRNKINLITQSIINDNTDLNQYVDQRLQYNVTNNNVLINQIFDNDQLTQKIQNVFIDNSQIHQKIENVVINSPEVNNRMLNFIVNSTEINNKINNLYRDVDIKLENIRNEWNQTFITLVRQYVDEVIAIIGNRESFNIQVANVISVKLDELLNQIWKIRNELIVFINNSERNLYEWTLEELMVIKGCLTDRQALVEQLITFSTELKVKLDNTTCVDINTFKPLKLISAHQQ